MKQLTVRCFWLRCLYAAIGTVLVTQPPVPVHAAGREIASAAAVGANRTTDRADSDDPEDETGENKTKKESTSTRELSVDELYIQDMLEEYLHPTKIKFLSDGRVRMLFEFSEKREDHLDIFTPPVETKVNSPFRWSLSGEESYYSYSRPAVRDKDGNYVYYRGGLRVSDQGMALLKCWFEDEVEAKISFGTGTNFLPGQMMSLIYFSSGRRALGSNFGSQCVLFRRGRPVGRSGKPESMIIYSKADFGLVVKDGEFEAHRNGRRKRSMKYSTKAFESGRIGFVWGGRLAGMIHSLEIKGRLDVPRMAKEMRKALRRRR